MTRGRGQRHDRSPQPEGPGQVRASFSDAPQVVSQCRGGRIASMGLRLQALLANRLQVARHLGVEPSRRHWMVEHHLAQGVGRGFAAERGPAGEHLVEERAQSVYVHAATSTAPPENMPLHRRGAVTWVRRQTIRRRHVDGPHHGVCIRRQDRTGLHHQCLDIISVFPMLPQAGEGEQRPVPYADGVRFLRPIGASDDVADAGWRNGDSCRGVADRSARGPAFLLLTARTRTLRRSGVQSVAVAVPVLAASEDANDAGGPSRRGCAR